MTPETALEAIRARIRGEWDNPALVEFGPLKTNPNADILDIIASVKHVKGTVTQIPANECLGDARANQLERIVAHARAMSDALLKVRPLGGSELFVKVSDDFYADPVFCGTAIDRLRQELQEERTKRVILAKALQVAAGELTEAADKFHVIHCNHPGEHVSRAQGEDKAFLAQMSSRMEGAAKTAREALK